MCTAPFSVCILPRLFVKTGWHHKPILEPSALPARALQVVALLELCFTARNINPAIVKDLCAAVKGVYRLAKPPAPAVAAGADPAEAVPLVPLPPANAEVSKWQEGH